MLGLLLGSVVKELILEITQQEFREMAWQAIVSSPKVAKESKHQIVETEHLMKTLLEQKLLLKTNPKIVKRWSNEVSIRDGIQLVRCVFRKKKGFRRKVIYCCFGAWTLYTFIRCLHELTMHWGGFWRGSALNLGRDSGDTGDSVNKESGNCGTDFHQGGFERSE